MAVVIDKILGKALMHTHIKSVSSDPASANDLDMIFNSTTNQLKIYYDSVWYLLHTLSIPERLLLETGDILLLETGSEVLLEV